MSDESPSASPLPPPPSPPPPPEQVSIELEVNVTSYNPTTVVTTPVKEATATTQSNSPGTIGRLLSRARTGAGVQLARFAPSLGDYIVCNILLLPLLILPSPFFIRNVDYFGPRATRVVFSLLNFHLLFAIFGQLVLFVFAGRSLCARLPVRLAVGIVLPLYMLLSLCRHYYNFHTYVFSDTPVTSSSNLTSGRDVLISLAFLFPCYFFPHIYRLVYKFQLKRDTRKVEILSRELHDSVQKAQDQSAFSNVDDEFRFAANLAFLHTREKAVFAEYIREDGSIHLAGVLARLRSFDQSGAILTRLPVRFTFYAHAARVLFIAINYWHGVRQVHVFWSNSHESMLAQLARALPGQPWNFFLVVVIGLLSLRFICCLFASFEPMSRLDQQQHKSSRTLTMTLKHPLFTLVFFESTYGTLTHLQQLLTLPRTIWWSQSIGAIISFGLLLVLSLATEQYAFGLVLFGLVWPLHEYSLKGLLTKLGKMWNGRNNNQPEQQQQSEPSTPTVQWTEAKTLTLIEDWYTAVAVYHFVQRFSKQFKQDFLLTFFTTGQVFESK